MEKQKELKIKRRKVCEKCKINPARLTKKKDRIISTIDKYCASCKKKERDGYSDKYVMKKNCEGCGFEPHHKAVLHVDHIDGNRKNNNPNNYQTLCANCHSIKSLIEARDRSIYLLSGIITDLETILECIGFNSKTLPNFREYKIIKIEKQRNIN